MLNITSTNRCFLIGCCCTDQFTAKGLSDVAFNASVISEPITNTTDSDGKPNFFLKSLFSVGVFCVTYVFDLFPFPNIPAFSKKVE